MSAGGQRGTDLSGITTMRIRDAADVTAQNRVKQTYQMFASATANAYANRTPNGNNYYSDFLLGIDECSNCTGLPYQRSQTMTFRNR
jgi:hypothetical protein